jgi:nicotinate phosphoribosyltransferase
MSGGKADKQHLGHEGVMAAKAHHLDVKAELPKTALRLSKGEPAIPTIFS